MFRRLAEHSARWEELTIGVTEYMMPLLATLRGNLPVLRRAWIQWDEDMLRKPINCFEAAPSLRDITIYNESPRQVRVLLPAQQLTRRLFVSTIDILDYLKAPALEEIALNLGSELNAWRNGAANDDSGNVDLIPHLDPFIIRSAFTLRRLSLRGSPHTHRVAELLRQYPSLVSLATLTSNPNAIISCLTVPSATADAAQITSPQLSEINIGSQFPIGWDVYAVMLESRWKMEGYALRSATTALVKSRPNRAQRAKLDALRKDGLDISPVEGREDASNLMNESNTDHDAMYRKKILGCRILNADVHDVGRLARSKIFLTIIEGKRLEDKTPYEFMPEAISQAAALSTAVRFCLADGRKWIFSVFTKDDRGARVCYEGNVVSILEPRFDAEGRDTAWEQSIHQVVEIVYDWLVTEEYPLADALYRLEDQCSIQFDAEVAIHS
ncbi:hypothetical protein C8F04DRAFT_1245171 [Mycena alexandri]|uniref:Uncharacterized protein n=1 Tax=Mycena alexandri TaxID=1745969 RepID=A0AAD6RW95_9AGAR|nr:hypothetical protein C8F04DRAFT_1245171 [Mycena alexandri]